MLSGNAKLGAVRLFALAASLVLWANQGLAAENWNHESQRLGLSGTAPANPTPEAWFPQSPTFPTARITTPAESSFQMIQQNQKTLVPLPAGEWTGLTCLAGLALVRARKAIKRMIS